MLRARPYGSRGLIVCRAAVGLQLRELVARPACGLDVARVLGVRFYLPADVLEVHVRGADLAVEVTAPEVGHDPLPAIDPPRIGGQERQNLELLGGQLDGPVSHQHLPTQEVYGKAG